MILNSVLSWLFPRLGNGLTASRRAVRQVRRTVLLWLFIEVAGGALCLSGHWVIGTMLCFGGYVAAGCLIAGAVRQILGEARDLQIQFLAIPDQIRRMRTDFEGETFDRRLPKANSQSSAEHYLGADW